jgi:hypothetical protein
MAAVMGRLCRKNGRDAEGIREIILSDNVSDSIDDGTEFDENYVDMTEGDSACAEDAMSDGYSCNEMTATDNCFQWKGQDEVGKVKRSRYIRRRWQNILRKLHRIIGQAGKTTTPFEAWNCLITDEILDNNTQHTNQYILIQPYFSGCHQSGTVTVWKNYGVLTETELMIFA